MNSREFLIVNNCRPSFSVPKFPLTQPLLSFRRSGPKDGACIHGIFMEGARWDVGLGCITEAKLKDLYPPMPVIALKAITQDKLDVRNVYECPVYKTRNRGPTYVWTFNLRTREKPSRWVLGGVAILLQV